MIEWLRSLWRRLHGQHACNAGQMAFEDTAELINYLDRVAPPASETTITRMTSEQIEARIRGSE